MNPILPRNHFVPDVEARVMPDGKLYLYGSYDLSGNPGYCSKVQHCFSTEDMVNFRDEGVIFRNDGAQSMFTAHPDINLYAPDAVHKDGKYYLFICCDGGAEGVAVADTPIGPFSDAVPVKNADLNGIDPSVFVDDDGTAYYFWGQFRLKGGILTEDMTEVRAETITYDIVTEHEHGFHEGASVRKYNGRYYLVYTDISRGRATCMSYAVADHPLGPYKKGGVIIDNIGCDPKTWNDHGSIECFRGQWYVFYHRSSQNSGTSRRVCAEPIFFDDNGMIREVPQSIGGAEGALSAKQRVDASIASRLGGGSYIKPEGDGECVFCVPGYCGAWIEYRSLNFGDGVSTLTVKLKGSGKIEARIESRIIGEAEFCCEDFTEITLPVESVAGEHILWLTVDGDHNVIDHFVFS